jgi:hypothetical protein
MLTAVRLTRIIFAASLICGMVEVASADCQGEFTPLANHDSPFTHVHFFPKNGNKSSSTAWLRLFRPASG